MNECRKCAHPEVSHEYRHEQATCWCHDCRAWCDFEPERCSCGVAALVHGSVPDPFCPFHGINR